MSVEFDTPANRIIQQLQPKNKFRIDTSLPDIAFLRQLSVQGRMWYEQAFASDTNLTLLTRTPPTGSTDFYYSILLNVTGSGTFVIILSTDGQTRWTGKVALGSHQFNIFDSLSGDGIKTINISVTKGGTASMDASLFGWTENTARIRDVAT